MTGLLSSGNGYLERYKINVLYGLNKYFDFIGVWYYIKITLIIY